MPALWPGLTSAAASAIVPRMNSTIALLKQCMAFQPVSDRLDNVNRLVAFLNSYLKKAGVYTRVETLQGRKILYAATRATQLPAILFSAHLDVVPATDAEFKIREKSGWLWGRGSADCLGHCALLAELLIALKGQADVGVIFATDEEIGGLTTRAMVEKGYRGKLAVIVDTNQPNRELCVAQKGICTIKLTAAGKACHGSTPWLGDNAIDRLIEGYVKVKSLFPAVKPGREWKNTCSANIINAGTVFNRIPDHAEMVLDIRHTEITTPVRLLRDLRKISGLKAECIQTSPVVFCDAQHPVLKQFAQFMSRHLGHPVPISRMNGATDARHFSALKVPIAILGAWGENIHGAGERVNINSLLEHQRMLVALCQTGLPALDACRS